MYLNLRKGDKVKICWPTYDFRGNEALEDNKIYVVLFSYWSHGYNCEVANIGHPVVAWFPIDHLVVVD